jgi:hypothetical protein
MYKYLYLWYNYDEYQIQNARNQVSFLLDKIDETKSSDLFSPSQKRTKIARMNLSIESIKYTFYI